MKPLNPLASIFGGRIMFWLLVIAVFFIIDLAILLYFLWPSASDRNAPQHAPPPVEIKKENVQNGPLPPQQLQDKE